MLNDLILIILVSTTLNISFLLKKILDSNKRTNEVLEIGFTNLYEKLEDDSGKTVIEKLSSILDSSDNKLKCISEIERYITFDEKLSKTEFNRNLLEKLSDIIVRLPS